MRTFQITVVCCIVCILIPFWMGNAVPFSAELDTLAQQSKRPCVAISLGTNFWTGNRGEVDGTAVLALTRSFDQGFGLWLDIGVWRLGRYPVAARAGISVRYDFGVAERMVVYPRVGIGIAWKESPYHATLGCGVWYELSATVGLLLEAGGYLSYRESERRSNYYFEATYIGLGLTFK